MAFAPTRLGHRAQGTGRPGQAYRVPAKLLQSLVALHSHNSDPLFTHLPSVKRQRPGRPAGACCLLSCNRIGPLPLPPHRCCTNGPSGSPPNQPGCGTVCLAGRPQPHGPRGRELGRRRWQPTDSAAAECLRRAAASLPALAQTSSASTLRTETRRPPAMWATSTHRCLCGLGELAAMGRWEVASGLYSPQLTHGCLCICVPLRAGQR